MFNSQKINNDPEPWKGESGFRNPCHTPWSDLHAPRPEFDNNPNPILLAFREAVDTGGGNTLHVASWWDREGVNAFVALSPSYIAPSQIAHARKVLERLAAL